MATTPQKVYSRLVSSPRKTGQLCATCGSSLNEGQKLRLFNKSQKTEVTNVIETIIDSQIDRSICSVVCRNCWRKTLNLKKKLDEFKALHESAVRQINSEVEVTKRSATNSPQRVVKRSTTARNLSFSSTVKETAQTLLSSKNDVGVQTVHDDDHEFSESDQENEIWVTMLFKHTPPKKVRVDIDLQKWIKCIIYRDFNKLSELLFQNEQSKKCAHTYFGEEITKELVNLCKLDNPSILRNVSKESLLAFSWHKLIDEWKERAPLFYRTLHASVSNPSQSRNIHKRGESLLSPMGAAGCILISTFNENMKAHRYINSLLLKKGHLNSMGVKRLASQNICMGYNTTIDIFTQLLVGFDDTVLEWKHQVEDETAKERQIQAEIQEVRCQIEKESDVEVLENLVMSKMELDDKLEQHQHCTHPGYYFCGDNCEFFVKVRQISVDHQNKDFHMFQMMAVKNRVSGNHLPNDKPFQDIKSIPFTTFLPNVSDNNFLVEELITLVGNVWVEHIPSLAG